MKPRFVEPVSLASRVWFSLREVGSRWRHAGARRAVRKRAEAIQIPSTSEDMLVNYGRLEDDQKCGLPIGGQVKLIALKEKFPEQRQRFHLIYLVSSALPPHAEEIVQQAKAQGAKLVWNQNGIAYPGCYGDSYAWFNLRMAALRAQADYVVNQSEFSRLSAERYLGPSDAPWQICLNPVDTAIFSPAPSKPSFETWEILSAGTSHALYRTKSALDTLRVLIKRGRKVRLTIAGEFRWPRAKREVTEAMAGMAEHVRILPAFSQSEAPDLYRQAHVLLHTKFNDPCPTVPIEAMACGVPVVATASGGLPELVSGNAGVLVPVRESWIEDLAGDPELLASAIEQVMAEQESFAFAARAHAVLTFAVENWLARHETIFRRV